MTLVTNSGRGCPLGQPGGYPVSPATIETNGHNLSLIFSDLTLTACDVGFAPFAVRRTTSRDWARTAWVGRRCCGTVGACPSSASGQRNGMAPFIATLWRGNWASTSGGLGWHKHPAAL